MGLIDSHAHLTYPGLIERIDEVLRHCTANGVERIITIGTTPTDARQALSLAARFPDQVSAAAGFHPHHAGEATDADFAVMEEVWRNSRVVAFGEMGLDYHYDFADRTVQQRVLERQLAMAAERDQPIIIHCREAFEDLVPRLLDYGFANRRVVFHCFTGTRDQADKVAAHGWRISFTGIVTFKKSDWLQDIAKKYPAEQLMLETDSPYLSPEPVRKKTPNEPAHIVHLAKFLARLRGVEFDALVEQTRKNTCAFFGI